MSSSERLPHKPRPPRSYDLGYSSAWDVYYVSELLKLFETLAAPGTPPSSLYQQIKDYWAKRGFTHPLELIYHLACTNIPFARDDPKVQGFIRALLTYRFQADPISQYESKVNAGIFGGLAHLYVLSNPQGQAITMIRGDFCNMGGMNRYFGELYGRNSSRESVDVLRVLPFQEGEKLTDQLFGLFSQRFIDVLRDTIGKTIPQSELRLYPVRTGGDEITVYAVGVDSDIVIDAVAKTNANLQRFSKSLKISEIPHTKENGPPGFGLIAAATPMDETFKPLEDVQRCDDNIALQKLFYAFLKDREGNFITSSDEERLKAREVFQTLVAALSERTLFFYEMLSRDITTRNDPDPLTLQQHRLAIDLEEHKRGKNVNTKSPTLDYLLALLPARPDTSRAPFEDPLNYLARLLSDDGDSTQLGALIDFSDPKDPDTGCRPFVLLPEAIDRTAIDARLLPRMWGMAELKKVHPELVLVNTDGISTFNGLLGSTYGSIVLNHISDIVEEAYTETGFVGRPTLHSKGTQLFVILPPLLNTGNVLTTDDSHRFQERVEELVHERINQQTLQAYFSDPKTPVLRGIRSALIETIPTDLLNETIGNLSNSKTNQRGLLVSCAAIRFKEDDLYNAQSIIQILREIVYYNIQNNRISVESLPDSEEEPLRITIKVDSGARNLKIDSREDRSTGAGLVNDTPGR